jgi:hypothetical protein
LDFFERKNAPISAPELARTRTQTGYSATIGYESLSGTTTTYGTAYFGSATFVKRNGTGWSTSASTSRSRGIYNSKARSRCGRFLSSRQMLMFQVGYLGYSSEALLSHSEIETQNQGISFTWSNMI